jgi:dipeptidyl aminopeptidase/acylaminoacyl peptidase
MSKRSSTWRLPRAPIAEVYRLFDQMKAPAELWVLPDQHHNGSITQKARSAVWEAAASEASTRESRSA